MKALRFVLYLYTLQMNNLFRDNYEKKMALIGVLKAYAENRSVDKLAKSLVLVLQTPRHRRLLPYIRSVISLLPRSQPRSQPCSQPRSQYSCVDFLLPCSQYLNAFIKPCQGF